MGYLLSSTPKNINLVEGLSDSDRHDCLTQLILKATEFTPNQGETTEKTDLYKNHPSEMQTELSFSRTKILINEKS